VNRGPSLANCSTAIVAAVVAEMVAREQREEVAQRRREEALHAVIRHPQRIACVDQPRNFAVSVDAEILSGRPG
jgi:hypothetical protein